MRLEGGQPTYNFSHLDALLDHLWRHQLRPGFELMGNPGNIFTDFENKTQVLWWRHLVALTARRYADRYGLEWVASWKWESWNEPDHHDFDNLNFTLAGQEDADSILTQELETIEKIRRNYPHLRHVPIVNEGGGAGGPGEQMGGTQAWWRGRSTPTTKHSLPAHTSTTSSCFDNAFLNYFPNFFEQRSLMARFQINTTLPRQAQLIKKDAYSVLALLSLLGDHVLSSTEDTRRKGLSVISTCRGCKKDANQESISIERFPDSPSKEPEVTEGLPGTPSQRSNNSGKQYEATPTQALTKDLEPENNFTASPQNPRDNTTENFPRERPTDDRTTPPQEDYDEIRLHFGNETDHQTPLNLTTTPNENDIPRERHEASSRKADLSSRSAGASAWEAAVLVARSNGTRTSREGVQVKVVLVFPQEVLGERLAVVTYQLGGKHKGPYEAWIDLGRPVEPSRKELAFIRSHEGGRRDGPRFLVASHNNLTMTMTMLVPDVTLIHVCQVFGGDPGQVTDVKALAVTRADLLLTWSDSLIKTRCVFGYQVERSEASRDGPYFSLTRRLLHHNNYFHSLPVLNGSATVQGWYRVRVVT
ncbi:alpha-L-iduronidase-like [Penaeus japonicus]|uniref:alpha-L-iduronidase-like n=1 Tax=Penaeus japonicus TaxID=27405 RepID=UPI001C71460E|nr:alpha-L-iduronidase-like [Penaeus japonicus]